MNTQELKFPYEAEDLSFAEALDIFIISLKNGTTVCRDPKDLNNFYNWLAQRQGAEDSVVVEQ